MSLIVILVTILMRELSALIPSQGLERDDYQEGHPISFRRIALLRAAGPLPNHTTDACLDRKFPPMCSTLTAALVRPAASRGKRSAIRP